MILILEAIMISSFFERSGLRPWNLCRLYLICVHAFWLNQLVIIWLLRTELAFLCIVLSTNWLFLHYFWISVAELLRLHVFVIILVTQRCINLHITLQSWLIIITSYSILSWQNFIIWLILNWFIKIFFHFSWNDNWNVSFSKLESGQWYELKVDQTEEIHVALQEVDLFQEKCLGYIW